jgi:hypothetical protein
MEMDDMLLEAGEILFLTGVSGARVNAGKISTAGELELEQSPEFKQGFDMTGGSADYSTGTTINKTGVTETVTGGTINYVTPLGGSAPAISGTVNESGLAKTVTGGSVTYVNGPGNTAPTVSGVSPVYNTPIIMGAGGGIQSSTGVTIIGPSGNISAGAVFPVGNRDGDILIYNGDTTSDTRSLPWLVKVYLGRDRTEALSYQSRVITPQNILDNWYRFSHANRSSVNYDHYGVGTGPAAGGTWEYDGYPPASGATYESEWNINAAGRITQPTNSIAFVGFASDTTSNNYVAELVVGSSDNDSLGSTGDDDVLSVVIALNSGTTSSDDRTLSLVMSRAESTDSPHGATNSYGLCYNFGKTDEAWLVTGTDLTSTGAWNTSGSVAVKVVRTPTGVTCWRAENVTTTLGAVWTNEITLNFADHTQLSGWCPSAQRWGIGARSQSDCEFSDIFFAEGGKAFVDDTNLKGVIFNAADGNAFRYNFTNNTWEEETLTNILNFVQNGQAVLDVFSGRMYFKQRGVLQPLAADSSGGALPASHTHAQTDITNLATTLAGKSDTVHGHAIGEITGLTGAISPLTTTNSTGTVLTRTGTGANDYAWSPASGVASNAAGLLWRQSITHSGASNTVTFASSYIMAGNDLVVYADGVLLVRGVDYNEATTTTITLINQFASTATTIEAMNFGQAASGPQGIQGVAGPAGPAGADGSGSSITGSIGEFAKIWLNPTNSSSAPAVFLGAFTCAGLTDLASDVSAELMIFVATSFTANSEATLPVRSSIRIEKVAGSSIIMVNHLDRYGVPSTRWRWSQGTSISFSSSGTTALGGGSILTTLSYNSSSVITISVTAETTQNFDVSGVYKTRRTV